MSGYHPDYQSLILEGMWLEAAPTEPGYYWAYTVARGNNQPEILLTHVEWDDWPNPRLVAKATGYSSEWELYEIDRWLGPLQEPTKPSE